MKFLKDIAAKLDRHTVARSAIVLGVAAAATFTGVASSALAYVGVKAGLYAAFGVSAVAASAAVYAATKVPSMFSAIKSFFSSKKEEKPVLRRSARLAAKNKAEVEAPKQEAADKPAVEAEVEAPKQEAADKPATEKQAAKKPTADKPAAEKPTADKPATEKPATDKPATEKQPASAEEVADEAVNTKTANVVRFTATTRPTTLRRSPRLLDKPVKNYKY